MPIELTPEQRNRIVNWFISHLPDGADAAKAATDASTELDRVNHVLQDAGIDYPLGARGVRDLATQRDGANEDRDEALAEAAKHKLKPADEGNGPMTAHELAHVLLAKPDLPVTIQSLGEGVEFVATYPGQVALLTGEDEVLDTPVVR